MGQKVAVVLPEIEPFSFLKGGALATWVKEVYAFYDKQQFFIFSPKTSTPFRGFQVIQTSSLPTNWLNFTYLKEKSLAKLVKQNFYPSLVGFICKLKGIKIFHLHNRPTYSIVIRKLNPSAKIIVHMHNDHFLTLNKSTLNHVMLCTDVIICVSDYIRNNIEEYCRANGVIAKPLYTLYNGVDTNKFKKLQVSLNSKVIFFSGRLIPEKGVEQLIDAFIKVLKDFPDAVLKIAGGAGFGTNVDTEFIIRLKEKSSLYPANILFLGFVNHQEIHQLYNHSIIYVCPSIWNDPFPLTVLEAMSSGLALVASEKGGIPEAVGQAGLVVNPSNVEQLSNAIKTLLKDGLLTEQLGLQARQRVLEYFTWEKVSRQLWPYLFEHSP
ncbi:group 1 glycosyl transferase [Flammeovirgaceae bacterium 311]|nr:group 1 glycosyl transferase [Flammeovirgaceae bacterium 311]